MSSGDEAANGGEASAGSRDDVMASVGRFVEGRVQYIAGMRLHRDVVDEVVLDPIKAFLLGLQERGKIGRFSIEHDYSTADYERGVLDVNLAIQPIGRFEEVRIGIGPG